VKFKYRITVKKGLTTLHVVEGRPIPADQITVEEASTKIIETEAFLERLTGLRFHIDVDTLP